MPPHPRQVASRDDRVRRQAVDLGRIQQQEERAPAADAVIGIVEIQSRPGDPGVVQLADPLLRPLPELVQGAELNGFGRARLSASGLQPGADPVVAQCALPGAPVFLTPFDHAERARRDAVAASVADVGLDDHRAELGAHQRTGGTHVQAGCLGAVLADITGHQPARAVRHRVRRDGGARRDLTGTPDLLDERDMPPRRGAQGARVVVGHAREQEAVFGHRVPLLARHLAGLAADAHRSVGEESHPGRMIHVPGARRRVQAVRSPSQGQWLRRLDTHITPPSPSRC